MVYMTSSELGWRPYKTQWVNKFLKRINKKKEKIDEIKHVDVGPLLGHAQIQELEDLFELYVDEAFIKLELYKEH